MIQYFYVIFQFLVMKMGQMFLVMEEGEGEGEEGGWG